MADKMGNLSGGLREAMDNYSKASEEPAGDGAQNDKAKDQNTHEGHSGHIHRHKNGSHHVTVHDKHGRLTHHSEHASWQEAAQELGQHGAPEGGQPSEDSQPGEGM